MTDNFIVDFMDVRCPNCNRLLFRIKGLAIIETTCKRCPGQKVIFPSPVDLSELKAYAILNFPVHST